MLSPWFLSPHGFSPRFLKPLRGFSSTFCAFTNLGQLGFRYLTAVADLKRGDVNLDLIKVEGKVGWCRLNLSNSFDP
jgi:hypothetical protein